MSARSLAIAVAVAWSADTAAARAAEWRKHEVTITIAPLTGDGSKGATGFRIAEADSALEALRPGRASGLLVVEIFRKGAIQRGDIITAALGLPTGSGRDFATMVESFTAGTRLKLEFWRYGDGFAQLQADLWRRAEANDAGATYALGHFERNAGREADHARAFGFFHRAAALGHPRAMEMAGHAYRDGRGVDKSPAEAAVWYRRAAEAGSASSMFSLGLIIATGQAGQANRADAFSWFQRAAAGGYAPAHFLVANYIDTGHGTTRDREAAAKHLIEAARGGSVDALNQFKSDAAKWKPSTEFISALQRRLQEAGTYRGPIDGKPSADVADALSQLQVGTRP